MVRSIVFKTWGKKKDLWHGKVQWNAHPSQNCKSETRVAWVLWYIHRWHHSSMVVPTVNNYFFNSSLHLTLHSVCLCSKIQGPVYGGRWGCINQTGGATCPPATSAVKTTVSAQTTQFITSALRHPAATTSCWPVYLPLCSSSSSSSKLGQAIASSSL